ncbi:MAG: acetyl-CoA C-acyltransferase [Gammaproteobacteria bacterium]|nr:acetyl-CoA C-acyltransferase [Gammaproteobacteria bacterium]
MARQIQAAYLVAAKRTAIGKAHRGALAQERPDDLLAHVLKGVMESVPQLDAEQVEDVVVGCAIPEAEQGLNVARMALLLAGLPESVPGVTVNRFCASGLQAVAQAADRIRLGEAEVMLAAGVESMSLLPMSGHRPRLNPRIFTDERLGIAYGMGLTAETVAQRWQVSREDQDRFALQSHQRALAAMKRGDFNAEILPYEVLQRRPNLVTGVVEIQSHWLSEDEGPRCDTSLEALAKLSPVFAARGSVTAGNSSQVSDGAAALLLCSEKILMRYGLQPLARFVGYSVVGVAPEIMGIGPLAAVPKLLKQTGVKQQQLDWVELNEAFAAQSLAVIRELGLDPAKVNPNGGAIALGHPLGATGAIRAASILHAMQQQDLRYGVVTMCIGTGMGAAALFEREV